LQHLEQIPYMSTVDKSGDRVKKMFAEIAPRYDLLNHVLSLNIDTLWRSKTVKALQLNQTDPVLDVCTGTGDLALAIARKYGGVFPVIGSDFCLPMLQRARSKQTKTNPGDLNLSFIEADTEQLPFPDNKFQAVTVAFGIRNVSETKRGMSEMLRVCKPGGVVAILEFSRPTFPGLSQLYDAYFRWVLPKIVQSLSKNDQSAYNYLPASVREFPSGRAMMDLMESIGLRDVKQTPMTFGVATLYMGTK
jgi:demethylmenaquinone methyltransferase / 2-methoxy-6-polyprenyl-1,4-benzoquinol methylase